jgi:hypothetical protein
MRTDGTVEGDELVYEQVATWSTTANETHNWGTLAKYNELGQLYTYKVVEDTVANYSTSYSAANGVYSDSANEATMGKGTTIVFTTEKQTDVAILNNLIRSIRVVFFDPSHGNAVFGLAKVTSVITTEEDTGRTVEQTVTGEDGTESTVTVPVIKYTITGTLELCQMVPDDAGTLFTAGEKLESQNLCALSQNIPQAISAMVYLDGNDVTSSDVLANGNIVGALNLQFASDADLKPMENSELRNGTANQGGGEG